MTIGVFDQRQFGVLGASSYGTSIISFSQVPDARTFALGVRIRLESQVNFIPSLTSASAIVSRSMPHGVLTLTTLVTTRDSLERIIYEYSKPCAGASDISVKAMDACSSKYMGFTCSGCVLTAVDSALPTQNIEILTCTLVFTFSRLWFTNA